LTSHYDPKQPRVPAGHHNGGQWTGGGSAEPGTAKSIGAKRHGLLDAILGPHGGDGRDDQVVQAAFLPRSESQSTDDAARGGPFTPTIPPAFVPGTREWWRHATRGHQGLADFISKLLRRTIGDSGTYRRCLQAADGSDEDWEDFCRSLGSGTNNVVGGQSPRRACWGQSYQPRSHKRNWCYNQFGAGSSAGD
jgi:hypothetical protein